MAERRRWRDAKPSGLRGVPPTQAQLTKLRITQHCRLAEQVRVMIGETKPLVDSLDQEIRNEQERTGVSDPAHFRYSTVAKAAVLRRDNLLGSMDTLKLQLEQVEHALADLVMQPTSGVGGLSPHSETA